MYNLLEYIKNHSNTSGSLWNYYRDELTETNDNNGPNKNIINSKSFKYKINITGNTCKVADIARDYDASKEDTKEIEMTFPFKYLSNFWRTLDMLLINC